MTDENNSVEVLDCKMAKFDFAVVIQAPVDAVWHSLTEQVDLWWSDDFRALGSDSAMTLDLRVGGGLVESLQGGEALEWYKIQLLQPRKSIYFVGYLAPDWGGPTMSMLKVSLEESGSACKLTISDALTGNVSESKAKMIKDGWQQLFADSLKSLVEAN